MRTCIALLILLTASPLLAQSSAPPALYGSDALGRAMLDADASVALVVLGTAFGAVPSADGQQGIVVNCP